MEVHHAKAEPWRVTLVDTGENTMTGGRLKRVREYLGNETFFMTYGDGVSNVDITTLLAYHQRQGTMATLTAVQPPGRFGAFTLGDEQSRVSAFKEKPQGDGDGAYINGGFFVLEPGVIDYISRRHDRLGARADGASRPQRTTLGLPPQWLLATDGYAARPQLSGRSVAG
jgi:glucose-1-phosphate cytidylyltransferase